MIDSLASRLMLLTGRLFTAWAVVALTSCMSPPKQEIPVIEPSNPIPEPVEPHAAIADARSARLADLESYAKRIRGASRNELAQEWALTAKESHSIKHAMLMLHPNSPQPNDERALDIVETLDNAERRIVLRAYAGFVSDQRRSEERQRDNLNAQIERTRKELRDENKRLETANARVEQEKQRADALAERLDELQRTLARLREIDKRLIDRSRTLNSGK